MVGCAEMDVVFYLFATSFVLCLFFVLSKPLHVKFSSDTVVGVQKFHQGSVPRIGGLAVFASLCIGVIFLDLPKQATSLVLASLPVFVFGLVEDLFKSVSSLYRLVASFATSVLFIILSGVYFTSVDIFLFDELFDVLFLWPIVTVIALSALMNSVNIIDGFNGLASGSSLLMTLALAVLAYQSGDAEILEICLCFSAVIFGFFLVNFPKGMLFLGDAGAYVLGFFLGGISIYLVEFNQEVTPLVLLVVFAYPIVELLFIYMALGSGLEGDLGGLQMFNTLSYIGFWGYMIVNIVIAFHIKNTILHMYIKQKIKFENHPTYNFNVFFTFLFGVIYVCYKFNAIHNYSKIR